MRFRAVMDVMHFFLIVISNVIGVVRFFGFSRTAIVFCDRKTTERRRHREEMGIEDGRGTAEHAKDAERKTEQVSEPLSGPH